ncbi:MAG: RNA-dependent RNA polymerase [Sanya totivirus 5]|nr:MAG: RNA-dependent RNA polymerase [Sanya totivirus 5]
MTRHNIPVWVQIRKGKVTLVSRERADYVLGHITIDIDTPQYYPPGHGRVLLADEAFSCYTIKCEGLSLHYVSVRTPTSTLPSMIKKSMSAHFSTLDNFCFGDFSGTAYLYNAFRPDRTLLARLPNNLQVCEEDFPRAKVSGEHHTHYRVAEIATVFRREARMNKICALLYERLRLVEGVTYATVCGFMLYLLYCRPQIAYIIALSNVIWEAKNYEELDSILNALSAPLKSLQSDYGVDLTQMFELQVLINRGVGKVDWDKEIQERVRPDVINLPAEKVYQEAMQIFKQGINMGFTYPDMTLKKYIQTRWEWIPSGAVHSQYPDDKVFMPKCHRHRNKFVAVNAMPDLYLQRIFERPPEIHAWASVKYEWAKQRAIYGVDLTSSIITNYAMFRCEEILKHRFMVGEDAEAGRVHKRLKYMLKDSESFCYDFDNFNAQHSITSMQAVLLAYRDTCAASMTPEQLAAMDWTIRSVERMIVHNNEVIPPTEYQVNGTLLSGWRLTTFINTVLNYIYFSLSKAFDTKYVDDSVHNGDDVLISVRSFEAALKVFGKMKAIGARAQEKKCNVFSIGEFLRVDHKVTVETGLGAQYLTRACATLAHSRIESQAPARLSEALAAAFTRITEVMHRSKGNERVSKQLLDFSVSRLSAVFGVDPRDVNKMLITHIVAGGLSAEPTASVEYSIQEETVQEELGEREAEERGEVTSKALMPGILDYALSLHKMFKGLVRLPELIRRISQATDRQLAMTRKTWLKIDQVLDDTKFRYGRALFRMYRNVLRIPYVDKAKFAGISPVALLNAPGQKHLRRIISGVRDVHYALKVLL